MSPNFYDVWVEKKAEAPSVGFQAVMESRLLNPVMVNLANGQLLGLSLSYYLSLDSSKTPQK